MMGNFTLVAVREGEHELICSSDVHLTLPFLLSSPLPLEASVVPIKDGPWETVWKQFSSVPLRSGALGFSY